jgi:hypothetical protein
MTRAGQIWMAKTDEYLSEGLPLTYAIVSPRSTSRSHASRSRQALSASSSRSCRSPRPGGCRNRWPRMNFFEALPLR